MLPRSDRPSCANHLCTRQAHANGDARCADTHTSGDLKSSHPCHRGASGFSEMCVRRLCAANFSDCGGYLLRYEGRESKTIRSVWLAREDPSYSGHGRRASAVGTYRCVLKARPATVLTDDEGSALRLARGVHLASIHLGDVPPHAVLFALSASLATPNIQYTVFHTGANAHYPSGANTSSVRFVRTTTAELARNLTKLLGRHVPAALLEADVTMANTLKPFFGGLFAAHFGETSHWGWIDLDVLLTSRLEDQVARHIDAGASVITFPDQVMDTLFTAGQLTLFANERWSRTFPLRSAVPQLLEKRGRHLYYDEECIGDVLAAHPAAHVTFDFGVQPQTTSVREVTWTPSGFDFGDREYASLARVRGARAFANASQLGASLRAQRHDHSCSPWLNNRSWACAPTPWGSVYSRMPSGTIEVALRETSAPSFLHLHQWKSTLPMGRLAGLRPWPLRVTIGDAGRSLSIDHDRVPRLVHFIWIGPQTDTAHTAANATASTAGSEGRDTRKAATHAFDWTMYAAVVAASRHISTRIMLHLLDGVEPRGSPWFEAARPLLELRSFRPAGMCNGRRVSNPAHVADFQRLRALSEHGGVYLDLDAIALRPWGPLLEPPSGSTAPLILGRQITGEVIVGTMAAAAHHPWVRELHSCMCDAYDGSWMRHSIGVLTSFFEERARLEGLSHTIHDNATFAPLSWSHADRRHWIHGPSEAGWDLNRTYAFHLYTSNSRRMILDAVDAHYLRAERGTQRTILRQVLRVALGPDGLEELARMLDREHVAAGTFD